MRHHEKMNVHQVSVRPHTEKVLLTEILVRCDIMLPVAAKNTGVFSVGVRAHSPTFSNNFSACVLCLIKTHSASYRLSSKNGAYFCRPKLLGYTGWLFSTLYIQSPVAFPL